MKRYAVVSLCLTALLAGQPSTAPAQNPFPSLEFLNGTWEAKAQGNPGVTASGTYTFTPELRAHILARHSTSSTNCKGPAAFDCEHSDLLYIYAEASSLQPKAIYFDNEGHVIHYNVSTPTPNTVIFLSESTQPGPQFRLIYELNGAVMSGKFQMHMPGPSEWKSYLEWSGKQVAR